MTGSACRFMPNGSNGAASSGHRRLQAWVGSRQPHLAVLWGGWAGATRNIPGGRRAPDKPSKKVSLLAERGASNHLFCDSIRVMDDGLESVPDDIEALKAALVAARAEVAAVRAQRSDDQALIAYLK